MPKLHRDELRRQTLALRMLRYQARSQTIRDCTGLTEDAIRNLYRAYGDPDSGRPRFERRRGRAPCQLENVLDSNAALKSAGVFVGLLSQVELLAMDASGEFVMRTATTIDNGGALCDAYDLYSTLQLDGDFSFEHAWFLWQSLPRSEAYVLTTCRNCDGLLLVDSLALRVKPCPWCLEKDSLGPNASLH